MSDREKKPSAIDCSAQSDFGSTCWSLVLAAGRESSPDSREALEALCRVYWYPLYAYVRRRVGDVQESQDLTQSFFVRLLEKDYLALADPARGRFRSFLLTSMKNFLVNEWKKSRALKRSAEKTISLDFEYGETRYSHEPSDTMTAERLYDKQWALALLDHVIDRLSAEFQRDGKTFQFEVLSVYITTQSSETSYAEAGDRLGMTAGAVKVAVHRLRRRYQQLLREEIAQTLAGPADVDEEIESLFASLGN